MPEQADNYKEYIKNTFDLVAPGYDNPAQRIFAFAADYMANIIQAKAGEKVLDVATGTAMGAIALAQNVRPGGRVHAIDISEQMLNKARENIDKHALDNIDLFNMDAEQVEFRNDYYDIVNCGFALSLLPDTARALKSWLRVLKPGGRLIISTFADTAFQPMLGQLFATYAELVRPVAENIRPRYDNEQQCLDILQQNGFHNCQTHRKQHGYHLATVDDWWEIVCNSHYRGLLQPLAPSLQAQIQQQHLQQVAGQKNENGIRVDIEVIYSFAQK